VSKEFTSDEKTLKESADKLKVILDNANDLITIINENFKCEYINEKAHKELLGYSRKDIIGKSPLTPLHQDDIKLSTKNLKDGFKYGEWRNEIRVRHKDSHYIWLENKGLTFIDSEGKKKAIIISRDISKRKKVEETKMLSEENYRSLINNLSDIILEGNSKGIISYVSPQCYDIMGYHPSEIIGKSAFDYIYPEDVPLIAESMKEGLKKYEMVSVPRYRLLHKNGKIIFVSAKGKYVKSGNTEKFIVAIRDITNQTKIEHTSNDSEEKYRLFSEYTNDLIFIFNNELEIEYVNKKPFLNILGYKVNELIGKKGIDFVHPEDREKILKNFVNSHKLIEGPIEARVKHKLGHFITTETNGKTFIDKDGKQKLLVIAKDITGRKRAENLMKKEYKKLEELSKIKSELLMQASHEFKTPLSSIYAASQILLNTYKEQFEDKPLEFIEMIYRGSQKLRQLIENLLDMSRIEADRLNISLKKENIVELINDCCSELEYWADKKDININIELPEAIFLNIDKIKIEQVFTNILTNAIKFTPPNGNIYINMKDKDQWVEISIRDTGIGLIKKEKRLLFQKFGKIQRTSKDTEIEAEGSGLGLYISKEIIELHHGKIFVKSKGRNKGSLFTIRLPKSQ
jgi:PAS domain S-box-containing protein